MGKKKKGMVCYIRIFCEAGALFLLYPILILSLSFVNLCLNTSVNVYLLVSLFILSSLFAYCSWEGERIEREEKPNNKRRKEER